jgi:hypothetical protein
VYTEKTRRYAKWDAIKRRGGARRATCDMTGEVIGQSGDFHELIPRAWTVKNPRARSLSYRPEVCAYLSQKAHRRFHDREPSRDQRDKMFQVLFRLYGYDQVKAVFDAIQDAMMTALPIALPDENHSIIPQSVVSLTEELDYEGQANDVATQRTYSGD